MCKTLSIFKLSQLSSTLQHFKAAHFKKAMNAVDISSARKQTQLFGRVKKLSDQNCAQVAKQCSDILKKGQIIGVPTDTIYGLAGDAQNKEVIDKIYMLKGRDFSKPVAICLSSIEEIYEWAEVTVPKDLLEDLLPGPVTLVFKRTAKLNPSLNPKTDLIGIRIPDDYFMIRLADYFGGPIALTSANISSQPSSLKVQEFINLWPFLALVVDAGLLGKKELCDSVNRSGSTVIDLSVKDHFKIIRDGKSPDYSINVLKKFGLTSTTDI